MWPEGRTVAVWLALCAGAGLGVTVWFDRVSVNYECAGANGIGGCEAPIRHVTALHLLEGSGIGIGVAVLAMAFWVGFTYCIPKQAAVVPTKRGRLG
jgi:hypothetical protein